MSAFSAEAAERQERDNAHCAAREHAAEVAGFVPRIAAALCNAVGEQRKRQPSDHAQPHRLRKQRRADVVNRHAHHGKNLQLVLGQQFHARSPPLCINYSTPSGKGKGVFEDSEAVAGTGFAVCPNRAGGSPLPGGDCGTRRGSCGTRRGSKKEGTPMVSLPL